MHPKALLDSCSDLLKLVLKFEHPADSVVSRLILLAMVSCRTAAMTYNRIADRDIDAINDRTKMRAIPSGLLSLRTTNLYFYASVILFVFAAASLNSVTMILSPALQSVIFSSMVQLIYAPLTAVFMSMICCAC